ncbi:hypothetical protein HMSSN139_33250 [Paenibacillus sp. HMSSN-139]|nr:hypothetical protein HMSSN139_33250 [Paenibacillus sp. HMSSN-139]
MLTGITIVFLGGDARQVEVINKCLELDATVRVVGFDRLETPLKGVSQETLSPGLLAGADVIILPVIGCDDQGVVPAPFSAEQLVIKREWFASVRKTRWSTPGSPKAS